MSIVLKRWRNTIVVVCLVHNVTSFPGALRSALLTHWSANGSSFEGRFNADSQEESAVRLAKRIAYIQFQCVEKKLASRQ
jgi:hypothetical protein